MSPLRFSLLLWAIIMLPLYASATSIPVQGYSFESPTASPHGFYGAPTGWALTGNGGTANLTTFANYFGIQGSPTLPSPESIDGVQIGWLHSGVFLQTIGVYDQSQTYTLNYHEASYYSDGSYRIALLVGSNILAQYNSNIVKMGQWDTVDSLVALPNANLSGNLTIELMHVSGYESDWDYIHLDATPTNQTAPVPEPSTMILLGGGLAGIVFWRRRKL